MTQKKYFYISLKWTRKNSKLMTFWGHNCSGYYQVVEKAGIYDEPCTAKKGVLSVEVEKIYELMHTITGIQNDYNLEAINVLPNTGQIRKELGFTVFDLELEGENDFLNIPRFKDETHEITKVVYPENTYHITIKENQNEIEEFWHYDTVIVAETKGKALNQARKEWYMDDEYSFFDFCKLVSCKKYKEIVFDKWSK